MADITEKYSEEFKNKLFFTHNIAVRWEEMDVNGHINYANYFSYFSEARIEAGGQSEFAELRENSISPVVYKAEMDFLKELFHPDTVHIVTWVEELIGKTRAVIRQNLYSLGRKEFISSARFFVVFMNIDTRKIVRLPEGIMKKFL